LTPLFIGQIVLTLFVFVMLLSSAAGMVYMERKVAALLQQRLGPYRVGPKGLLQPLADIVKLMFKEELRPRAADPLLFALAPILSATAAFAVSAAKKLKTFHDDAELAAFLAGLFVIPLVELQTAFHEQRAALFHVLRERFSLPAKSVHIHKGHFFLLLARFGGPVAVHRKADFGDGHALGSVAQLRIARQVPD